MTEISGTLLSAVRGLCCNHGGGVDSDGPDL